MRLARAPFVIAIAWMAFALVTPPLAAQVNTDNIAQQDSTRGGGVIYDSQGNPMPKVEMWIQNDNAPADRARGRSRATGAYLVRGIGRLFTERDMAGIMLRLTFEAEGFESLVLRVAAPVNTYTELSPILAKPGEDLSAMRPCLMLRGKVSRGGKKGIRDVVVTVSSPDDPELAVQATTAKDGTYEVLLWGAPPSLVVTATNGSDEQTKETSTGGQPVHDRVSVIQQDFAF